MLSVLLDAIEARVETGETGRCGGAVEFELNEDWDKGEAICGWPIDETLSLAECVGMDGAVCIEPCLILCFGNREAGDLSRVFFSSSVFVRGRLLPTILLASVDSDLPKVFVLQPATLPLIPFSFCRRLPPGEAGGLL